MFHPGFRRRTWFTGMEEALNKGDYRGIGPFDRNKPIQSRRRAPVGRYVWIIRPIASRMTARRIGFWHRTIC